MRGGLGRLFRAVVLPWHVVALRHAGNGRAAVLTRRPGLGLLCVLDIQVRAEPDRECTGQDRGRSQEGAQTCVVLGGAK